MCVNFQPPGGAPCQTFDFSLQHVGLPLETIVTISILNATCLINKRHDLINNLLKWQMGLLTLEYILKVDQ